MVRSQRLGAGRCFVRIERVINHLYYYASCDGRLFEVTEIATTDDKMLMEEMLNNITWTSTGARQTDLLLNFLAVCDSA